MNAAQLADWLVQALQVTLWVSAPALAASVVAGTATAITQTATQVQDPALGFVPRLLAVGAALALGGAWMGRELVAFTSSAWHALPGLLR